MILIFTSQQDHSIISSIEAFSKTNHGIGIYVLFYETYLLDHQFIIDVKNDSIRFIIDNECIELSSINLIWYKQFGNKFNIENVKCNNKFRGFYQAELKEIHEFVHKYIYMNVRTINSPLIGITNKLEQLAVLNKLKLNTPSSYITNYLENLDQQKKYITKSLSSPPISKSNSGIKIGYTRRVKKFEFNKDSFVFPTFIQNEIKGVKELRIFFFLGKVWAILIDTDRSKYLDYRITNYGVGYSSYSVQLKRNIKSEITKIMKSLQLDSGSIDVLINEEDQLTYLEINKYGQFGMIENSRYMDLNILEMLSAKC